MNRLCRNGKCISVWTTCRFDPYVGSVSVNGERVLYSISCSSCFTPIELVTREDLLERRMAYSAECYNAGVARIMARETQWDLNSGTNEQRAALAPGTYEYYQDMEAFMGERAALYAIACFMIDCILLGAA